MYNILICDDEQDIVNALKIYLSAPDFAFYEASNGLKALQIIEDKEIHLVLLDIMMPQMDGIATLAEIRKNSNVPVKNPNLGNAEKEILESSLKTAKEHIEHIDKMFEKYGGILNWKKK